MKLTVVLLCCSTLAYAKSCEKGWTEVQKGVCMEGAVQTVVASDEKPPSDKMPSYQRAGIHTVEAPNKTADDIAQDEEAKKASAIGQANCEKKFGKGKCGEDTGKRP